MSEPPAAPEKTLAAGPLFLFGLALAVLGLLRRRPVLVVGGAAAMWVDRESVLGGLRGDDLARGRSITDPSREGCDRPPRAGAALERPVT